MASAALLLLLLWGCATRPGPVDLPNLGVVTNGVYRCGQPTAAGMRWLLGHGVSNVVKLNVEAEPVVQGLTVWRVPISLQEQVLGVSRAKLLVALSHLGPGSVVHCEHGQDRTGLLVALLRVREGWSRGDAEREMLARGFHRELWGLWEAWEDWGTNRVSLWNLPKSQAARAAAAAVVAPGGERILRMPYTTNRFHAIQESGDLVSWRTVPGLGNCYGAPSGELVATNNQRAHWWRALPHREYWP